MTLDLAHPIILIEGVNGSGKTSLLEALHYLCYLRSFRTHLPRDLIHFGQDSFFVKAILSNQMLDQPLQHEIQVGFSGKKRLVKVDQKTVCSYKELMDHYRVVTLTEDDLLLIKGGPDIRRSFLDQALLLHDPNFIATIRNYKQILHNRNATIQNQACSKESYDIWTKQLWDSSRAIQVQRMNILDEFECEVNSMLKQVNEDFMVTFTYLAKKTKHATSLEAFLGSMPGLCSEEMRYGRSLFGAHLDDIIINFRHKKSKAFASRGQQKLITLLLKIAQIKRLCLLRGPAIFLLDDFMTDFDIDHAQLLLSIITKLKTQLIFTSPVKGGPFEQNLLSMGAFSHILTD